MYRVLLRVVRVQLHIKQSVVVEINLRKNQKTLTIPQNFAMVQGFSFINQSYEFHISNKNPQFQLCVILSLNNRKKMAGEVRINLLNFPKQQTMHIEDRLQRCPDKNSVIQFQFTYMKSPEGFVSIELISEGQIKMMQMMLSRCQVQSQKGELQKSNRFLESQYKKSLQQNRKLSLQLDKMQDQESQVQHRFQGQLQRQQLIQSQCLERLQKQKVKMAEILDLVFQSGDVALIEMIQEEMATDK